MMKTIDNKYHTWYNSLVERARNRVIEGYVEKHHIIPRSLGGTNEPSNIVALTAREHLIAHMLLPRFVGTPGPMWSALFGMMNLRGLRVGSRVYEEARIRHAEVHSAAMRGRPRSEEAKAKVSAALKGRPNTWTAATQKGRSRSEEIKAKIAATLSGRKRPEHSAAMKGRPNPKVSAALKGRKQADWVIEAKRQRVKEYWAKKKLASSEEVV